MNSFQWHVGPDLPFLKCNISVAIPVLDNVNQVYIFIMLSTVQSNETLSHGLSPLRIIACCEVGDVLILQIGKLSSGYGIYQGY